MQRSFTPAEVEALIPELARVMGEVMPAREAASALQAALHDEQRRVALAGGVMIDRTAWEARAAALQRHVAVIERGLGRITELGGVPKDLTLGLVDFPHRRGDQEVYLCWQYGESVVRFWHGLDEGYAGRKPL